MGVTVKKVKLDKFISNTFVRKLWKMLFRRKEFCLLVGLIKQERSLVSEATDLFGRKPVYKDLLKSLILASILFWASTEFC